MAKNHHRPQFPGSAPAPDRQARGSVPNRAVGTAQAVPPPMNVRASRPLVPPAHPRRPPRPGDEPDPDAMRNRPVRAAGSVVSMGHDSEAIPEDSRGGVQTSDSVQVQTIPAHHRVPPRPPARPSNATVPRGPKAGLPGSAQRRRAMEATVRVEVLGRSDRKRRLPNWLYLAGGVLAIAGGLVAAGWGYRVFFHGSGSKTESKKHKPVRLVFPPGKCPKGMVWISWKNRGFCIDIYEYPNERGHRPRSVSDVRRARALCAEAGKRLCTASEWRRACGGPMLLAFPYGGRFNPSKCPTRAKGGPPVPIQLSGSWTECRTSEGVHDMSGNMAEWVSEGLLVGGSGMLTGQQVSCRAQGGAGQPAYYGSRCCLSPAQQPGDR